MLKKNKQEKRMLYTFNTTLSLEADSEEEARTELARRLDRLHKAEYVGGFEVMGTPDLILATMGDLR